MRIRMLRHCMCQHFSRCIRAASAEITQHMKHGAYFITSGIINTKEQEVVDAFKKNPELEIVEVNHDGEWVNVTARRR